MFILGLECQPTRYQLETEPNRLILHHTLISSQYLVEHRVGLTKSPTPSQSRLYKPETHSPPQIKRQTAAVQPSSHNSVTITLLKTEINTRNPGKKKKERQTGGNITVFQPSAVQP